MINWHSKKKSAGFKLGRFSTNISYRSSDSIMGRFGGGWNWKLGFQASSQTIIISLLVVEWTLSVYRKKLS